MKKIVIERPGGYERLRLRESTTLPRPKPGEVLVEVRAAGVNYADCVIRMGLYQSAKDYVGWPITPDFEFSGKVLEIGNGVEGFQAFPAERVADAHRALESAQTTGKLVLTF